MPGEEGNPIDVDNPPAIGFAGPSAAPLPVKVESTEQNPPPQRRRPMLVPEFYGADDIFLIALVPTL